jgi:hypothetical protein
VQKKRHPRSSQNERVKPQPKSSITTWPIYLLLVLLFVLYIVFQGVAYLSVALGALIVIMIIALVVLEVALGAKEQGYMRNIAEVAAALVLVGALWFGMEFFLHTSHPIDVVPSCSMLPYLHRGDMIVLQGVSNISQIRAPVVNVSDSTIAAINSNISRETLACVAYRQTASGLYVSQFLGPGYSVGLLHQTGSSGEIVPNSFQAGNPVQYTCGTTNVLFSNGTTKTEAYTTAITIDGTTIKGDANNSVVVYGTVPGDLFYKYGDAYIVHRVYAVLRDSSTYYVLTKGDNNPGLDLQYSNYPASASSLQGLVVASIPYVGYLKLALSGSFVEPTGCNYTTQH